MALPEQWSDLSMEGREEWLLGAVDADPLPLDTVLDVVQWAAEKSQLRRAVAWCDLLLDALVGARNAEGVVRALALRGTWDENPALLTEACDRRLGQVFRTRSGKALVDAAGFGSKTPPAECLRRLQLLLELKPDVMCYDKTWGFGVVRKSDSFYGKVTIDFESKRGHAMSFAYAAETLERLPEGHILIQLHADRDRMLAMVQDDPAQVVRMALASYGELPVPLLRERLENGIVDPDDWKRFWDAARKQLKSDPLIEIPTRRNAPIRVLSREKRYDAAWFETLSAERDMATIMTGVRDLEAEGDVAALDEGARRVLANRLGFVALGAETQQPALAAQACVAAARLGLATDETIQRVATHLLEPERFAAAAEHIPARELGGFVAFLAGYDGDALRGVMLDSLGTFSVRLLDEAIAQLASLGELEACMARLRELVSGTMPPVTVICWLSRHLDWLDRHAVMGREDLLLRIVEIFERNVTAYELKARNTLRTVLEQGEWLEDLLASVAALQRETFLKRVVKATGWDATERRSIMARVLKRYPELQRATETSERATAEPVQVRRTSWRSYRERQASLKHLIEVDIPDNSREIGVARSYGDLRENFEYQAAKDRQRLLMQRQAELEADLKDVSGSDFAEAVADKAGMATCVWLRDDADEEKRITILGEWDRDEALDIISSGSALAKALDGHVSGDHVEIPATDGTRRVTITRVAAIEEDIRAWMKG